MKPVKGFTLVELMATLTIISIVGLISAPTVSKFMERNKVNADTGKIINIINTARINAISKKKAITICGRSTSEKCSRDWSELKVIHNTDKELIHQASFTSNLSKVTWYAFQNKPGLTIGSTGYTSHQNGTLYMCHGIYDDLSRAIIVSKSGRVSVDLDKREINERCRQ